MELKYLFKMTSFADLVKIYMNDGSCYVTKTVDDDLYVSKVHFDLVIGRITYDEDEWIKISRDWRKEERINGNSIWKFGYPTANISHVRSDIASKYIISTFNDGFLDGYTEHNTNHMRCIYKNGRKQLKPINGRMQILDRYMEFENDKIVGLVFCKNEFNFMNNDKRIGYSRNKNCEEVKYANGDNYNAIFTIFIIGHQTSGIIEYLRIIQSSGYVIVFDTKYPVDGTMELVE